MIDLYGLLGEKLSHSLSPEIHRMIMKKLGWNGEYLLFEVEKDSLKTALDELDASGAKGVNVTIPYKIDVMGHIDTLSKEAAKIGAVNTIKFGKDKRIGYNTDYYGLAMTFSHININPESSKFIVLGSGGSAVTLLQYLKDGGASEITVVVRDKSRLKSIEKLKDFNLIVYEDLRFHKSFDVVVNCTPCGMYPNINECPLEKDIISQFNTVVDLIYNPVETVLLKTAKDSGARYINGLYMLVCQAVASQELWNDIKLQDSFKDEIYEDIKKIRCEKSV